ALRRERQRSYLQGMALAEREYLANNVGRVEQLLDECPEEHRNWEWRYLRRLCHTELLTLRGHTLWVNAVAFTADGKRLVSGSAGKVHVRAAADGAEVLTLAGHNSPVQCVAYSRDGRRLASAGEDRKVRIWDAATGQELQVLTGHVEGVRRLAFSPDGRRLVS